MNKREIIPGDTAYNKLYPLPNRLPKIVVLIILSFIVLVSITAVISAILSW